jgi:opacity protein-like surface antigen
MSVRRHLPLVAIGLAILGLVAGSLPASAQRYDRKGTFVVGGGFNNPVSEASDYLNSSGTVFVGMGRNLNRSTTLQAEWTHNWLEIDPEVLERAESDSVQYNDASASSWSITLNLVRRFNPEGESVPWLTGGIGYYKRNLKITENAWVFYPPVFDPWWGWIDGGWAPGETITGKRETSGLGFNVGIGLDAEIDNGASLFLDLRYHHALLDGVDVTLVPIVAGIRW